MTGEAWEALKPLLRARIGCLRALGGEASGKNELAGTFSHVF